MEKPAERMDNLIEALLNRAVARCLEKREQPV
jgi:hypothetical protein